MGRTTGRSPEDTRRLVLDAAASAIRTHGIGATLDLVAREAGISKGGLVYHFPSKTALLVALAQGSSTRSGTPCTPTSTNPRAPPDGWCAPTCGPAWHRSTRARRWNGSP